MCMATVKKTVDNLPPTVAWKVVDRLPDKGGTVRTTIFGVSIPFDKWVKARAVNTDSQYIMANDSTLYRPGFHTYESRDAARRRRRTYQKVVKVLIRGRAVYGDQSGVGHMGWTAQYMMVPKPRKEGGC